MNNSFNFVAFSEYTNFMNGLGVRTQCELKTFEGCFYQPAQKPLERLKCEL